MLYFSTQINLKYNFESAAKEKICVPWEVFGKFLILPWWVGGWTG